LEKLLAQWPNYIAFLASFFYTGVIWLNHRAILPRALLRPQSPSRELVSAPDISADSVSNRSAVDRASARQLIRCNSRSGALSRDCRRHVRGVGLIGWAGAPTIALRIFLALPIFYEITSDGLTETRI
jgi:TMEM175 potassium channel family protein